MPKDHTGLNKPERNRTDPGRLLSGPGKMEVACPLIGMETEMMTLRELGK